jgi:hypothetical protein
MLLQSICESVTVGANTVTNTKNLDLMHSFVSNKIVGPDRFIFITSYWTSPDTSLGVDAGTSANNTFLSAGSLPPNTKLEVDTNEGFSTLAVALQYQGVVDLAGTTAALKLVIPKHLEPSSMKIYLAFCHTSSEFYWTIFTHAARMEY